MRDMRTRISYSTFRPSGARLASGNKVLDEKADRKKKETDRGTRIAIYLVEYLQQHPRAKRSYHKAEVLSCKMQLAPSALKQ
jgi:hypothetical protein